MWSCQWEVVRVGKKKVEKVVKVVVTQGLASTTGIVALNYERQRYSPRIRVPAVLRKTPAHEFRDLFSPSLTKILQP